MLSCVDSGECKHKVTDLIKEKKMRRLLGLAVMFVVLCMCVPSYATSPGYILAYKVTGSMKAAEWYADKIISVSVKGYIAVNIVANDTGDNEIVDAQIVLYGKNKSGNLVYYRDYLNDPNSGVELYTPGYAGDIVEVQVWDHTYNPMYYEFVMTGNVKAADIGLGAANKQLEASSLKGSLITWWAQLLDSSQELFGSGAATATLDTKQTKAANAANATTPGSVTVDDIITTFIAGLKGYSSI
jgi:hypothetical protein